MPPNYNNVLSISRGSPGLGRSLNGGGSGDNFDPMEHRVARLEADIKEVKSDLKEIRVDLAEIKGRISQLPTIWQIISLVIAILGAVFAFLRFGLPTH